MIYYKESQLLTYIQEAVHIYIYQFRNGRHTKEYVIISLDRPLEGGEGINPIHHYQKRFFFNKNTTWGGGVPVT